MIFIVVVLVMILILTTVRAVKIKSFKIHLLIDGIIFAFMLIVVLLRQFALGTVICLGMLLLWIAMGTLVRKSYSKFDLWMTGAAK